MQGQADLPNSRKYLGTSFFYVNFQQRRKFNQSEFSKERIEITDIMEKTATLNSYDIHILEDKLYDIDMFPPKKDYCLSMMKMKVA